MTSAQPNQGTQLPPARLRGSGGVPVRFSLAIAVALGAVLSLPGCDSSQPRDDGARPGATNGESRGGGSRRAGNGAGNRSRAVADVDEEAARYKNLFDAMEFDSLARSRRRLVEAGKPGINFLVQFLLIRSLAVPVGEAGQAEGDRIARFRNAAERELVTIGVPATDYLGEIAVKGKTDFAGQAARMLALMGEPGVPALTAAVRKAKPKQRRQLVKAMGGTGSPRALDLLIDILGSDGDWQVRGLAAGAVGVLGRDLRSEKALGALESAARRDEDLFVVQKCAEGFIVMDDAGGLRGAVVALERLLTADPPQLAQGKALVKWMRRKSGLRHGLDIAAWKRAIR